MVSVEDILLSKGSDLIGASPAITVRQAARMMSEASVGCVVVQEDHRPVGIFTERDLVCRVLADGRDPDTTALSEVMSSPVQSCHPDDDVLNCGERMHSEGLRHLIVLDGDEPVGMVSIRDLLAARTRRA
jgi:CBS domain-containing protein